MKKLIVVVAGLLAMMNGCKTDDFDFDIPPIVTPTTTTTVPVPTTTTTQPTVADTTGENNIVPAQLYAPVYSIDGATEGKLSVWNPANSKGKGKAIFAGKYCNKIAWCTFFAEGYQEKGKRSFPNESSNRPRFYTLTGIDNLPQSIYIRAHIIENGVAKDIYIYIADTRKRQV